MIVVRLTFVLSLLVFLITYAISPDRTHWASMKLPDAIRIAGGVLVFTTIPCFVLLFRHLGKNVTPTANTRMEHSLVVTGPYRWVRHPMYTAGIAFWLGMSLFAAKWFLLFFVAAAFVFLMIRTPREEANLLDCFGDEYLDYQSRTGRYFPKLSNFWAASLRR
jgi:protein-S-isoprenylcysteine O-methyltransferase Ste14